MAEAAPISAPRLFIAASDLALLKTCAAGAYPLECCGLLVGHDGFPGGPPGGSSVADRTVIRVVPAGNCADQPARTFEIDPAVHIALLRALRQQGGAGGYLIGHYHSHPDAPPVPSARDLAQAMEPGAVWLIIAANASGGGEIRAWRALGDDAGVNGFQPMKLTALE
ncbi:Mov34/MPN/PAD-1 family protein [Telmatospirillum siberiense]|uniref:MPN domain-containing protein n=1 Tax=Telmatospirillum siberiense TaxID=382514 RepID=A0A2N3Q1C8_9PROT|nr:M67 family metallopeptidase [Telmatospirillum siberiense]PKU26457.1 hypothetical protein CWS72_01015 [Telmatospirillum siberiense]